MNPLLRCLPSLRFTTLTLSALAMLGSISRAQEVVHIVHKAADYRQTDTTTVAFNPEIGYNFIATLNDLGATPALDATNPASAPTVTGAQNFSLAWDTIREEWRYSNGGYTDLTAFDLGAPNGNYTFGGGSFGSATVALTGDLYPNVPLASFSSGTWSDGIIMVDSTQPLTISSSLFTTNYAEGFGRIEIHVIGDGFFASATNNNSGDSLDLDLSAFDLVAGTTYEVDINFSRFADLQVPGNAFVASYVSITTMTLQTMASAVPEPGSAATLAALATLGVVAGIRRRPNPFSRHVEANTAD